MVTKARTYKKHMRTGSCKIFRDEYIKAIKLSRGHPILQKDIPLKIKPAVAKTTESKKSPVPEKLAEPARSADSKIEVERKQSDRWSDCGQIFFTAGKAFAIAPNLRTICLGGKSEVKGFLDNGQLDDSLNPVQKKTLIQIKEFSKPPQLAKAGESQKIVRTPEWSKSLKVIEALKIVKTRKAIIFKKVLKAPETVTLPKVSKTLKRNPPVK